MRYVISLVCAIALAAAAVAQNDSPPSPTPVPFTPDPHQLQWRLGFNLGNAMILETPELNPENDFHSAVSEAERIIPRPTLAFGLALLPFTKLDIKDRQLINPRQW